MVLRTQEKKFAKKKWHNSVLDAKKGKKKQILAFFLF